MMNLLIVGGIIVVVFCVAVTVFVCRLAWKISWSLLDSHEQFLSVATDEMRKVREELKLLREELPWACTMTARERGDDRSSHNGPTPRE